MLLRELRPVYDVAFSPETGCQRDGCADCEPAPAACGARSYGGRRHVQSDPLRKRQADWFVAVPCVRSCPATGSRAKGKGGDETRSSLSEPPQRRYQRQASPIRSPSCPPQVLDHSTLIGLTTHAGEPQGRPCLPSGTRQDRVRVVAIADLGRSATGDKCPVRRAGHTHVTGKPGRSLLRRRRQHPRLVFRPSEVQRSSRDACEWPEVASSGSPEGERPCWRQRLLNTAVIDRYASVLDEGRRIARVLPLLLDRSLFLRCVLRLLLAFLRGLMGHGSLRCCAEAMAPHHYRPTAMTLGS